MERKKIKEAKVSSLKDVNTCKKVELTQAQNKTVELILIVL